ncbi:MAG: hypothetical protein ACO3OZ_17695, partial [bacterium]
RCHAGVDSSTSAAALPAESRTQSGNRKPATGRPTRHPRRTDPGPQTGAPLGGGGESLRRHG